MLQCFEVQTPNMDSLVDNGILLERHYAYKICSPSRCSLQTGRLAVHVNTVNTGVTYWNPGDNVSGAVMCVLLGTEVVEPCNLNLYQAQLAVRFMLCSTTLL